MIDHFGDDSQSPFSYSFSRRVVFIGYLEGTAAFSLASLFLAAFSFLASSFFSSMVEVSEGISCSISGCFLSFSGFGTRSVFALARCRELSASLTKTERREEKPVR